MGRETLLVENIEQSKIDARVWSRYLIGREASDEIAARYAAAIDELLCESDSEKSDGILQFVRKHPWSTGALDAVSVWRCPNNQFRRRLLVLTAILEASVDHTDRFLPITKSRIGTLAGVSWLAASGAAKRCIGLILILTVVDR